jgi:hypothetical protein
VPEQHDPAAMTPAQAVADKADRDASEDRRDEQEKRRVAAVIAGNRRSLQLTALILVLFLIDFFWSSHTQVVSEQDSQAVIAKACDFWYPLTSLPVTVLRPGGRPSELSVRIIAGARESYDGQCRDSERRPLPPPDPSFAKWARVYHVPVTR